jgi:signal transduction histidine kinase
MGAVSDKTCLPKSSAGEVQAADLCPAKPAVEVCGDGSCRDTLLQEFTQLQERYSRMTNALASAAHDLKTPLAILNGYVEVLRSEKLGPLNGRQREVLQDMNSSGQRLQHFIQDFLSYSVLETGEMRMRYETGDINATLSEVCDAWLSRFQERGVALYFLANERLAQFSFDAARIQRIISNLLENASKFTPAGGTVWLHAEPYMWERRSAEKSGSPADRRSSDNIAGERRRQPNGHPNSVKVSVSDTGPGIPPEYHIEVFDDFFRLPNNEKQTDGMGLGLAIARRLVNGMGGKIWVESEPGAGCKFSFILPLQPVTTTVTKGKTK